MLIAMLAVLQHAVILLMPSVSALITPLGLAQMQMQVCLYVRVSVCKRAASEKNIVTRTYPLALLKHVNRFCPPQRTLKTLGSFHLYGKL